MLFVRNILLTQFRNYQYASFSFKEKIVAVCGLNGSGKTNLLDAVYYCCFTKSYFSKPDAQSVYPGLRGFRIEAVVEKNNSTDQLVCILRENNRKEFLVNGELYKKFSSHIGKYPCVFIAPDDVQLVTEGSEVRRSFIDTIISQLDAGYLQQIIDYKKILEERNSLLKAFAEKNYFDETLLEVLDKQLVKTGNEIYSIRKSFLQRYIPLVIQSYEYIGGNGDDVELSYYSPLHSNSFEEILQQNRSRDLYLQRTSSGIHKDDIELQMQQLAFKSIASQGQRKSILFALKLAEYEIIQQEKGFAPLLLLDDIFEKLDGARMHNLLEKVCIQYNGQVFITDTHKQRLEESLSAINASFQLIELND